MEQFTKWEEKSVKAGIVFPIVFLVLAIVLIAIMASIRTPPIEVKKKDAATAEQVEEAQQSQEIDWKSF
jgi:Na+/proline symporter